jgi:hypothetical protein
MTSPTTTTVEVLQPRVVDNDRDEITVTLDGKEIRGWSYETEAERRVKIRLAREFCEGWHQAKQAALAIVDGFDVGGDRYEPDHDAFSMRAAIRRAIDQREAV